MQRAGYSICLVFLLCASVRAQGVNKPTIEAYGGYSHLSNNSMPGWNASAAVHTNRWFGIVADFGGHYKSERTNTTFGQLESNTKMHTFMFGPRFSLRESETVTPFAHVLLGAARLNTSARFSGTSPTFPGFPFPDLSVSRRTNSFALAAGGGLDIRLTDKLALRLIQIEYLQTHFFETTQNRARASAGLVVRF